MSMNAIDKLALQAAIDRGVNRHFDHCRGRVDDFVQRHFRWPGAWHTNKAALGWDLLRAPINLIWAPCYVFIIAIAWLCKKLGWSEANKLLTRTPGGFTTAVQKHIAELIYTDLLQRTSENGTDQLQVAIVDALDDLVAPDVHNEQLTRDLEPVVADALKQYGLTRTASADIANSLLTTLVGAFTFQKFTPGGMAIGILSASWLANKLAVRNFFFGEFFGNIYYSFFPASPSPMLTTGSVVAILICLSIIATFSGLITDPLQSWTGIHRHRLNKLIDTLQRDYQNRSTGSFRPKDQFVARVLEILDAAKSQLI